MEIKIKSKTHGEIIFLVDDEDYIKILKYKWHVYPSRITNSFYIRTDSRNNDKHETILLHRLIMNAPKNLKVDHINHNTLDNRKCNLRICTHSENQRNQKIRKGLSSKYKGVHIKKGETKYTAQIKVNGKQIGLGKYINERDAAIAYNEAAIKYHKEFANINNV